jgi:hypothetical protein
MVLIAETDKIPCTMCEEWKTNKEKNKQNVQVNENFLFSHIDKNGREFRLKV